ncbi:MAG: ParB/RepB/Spo0J family partition protein [Phycisphaerae bacterium]|nr:ParB/RepB/Spo0J family partition protein [Phycisphaerae bacterium]
MQLCELEIRQIKISGDNPRIINKKNPKFTELVDSIKAMGVQIPIHVRNNPKGEGYELLAGERRLLAAGEAGLDKIPAINKGDLGDDEAFNVTFIENVREDLTVLEQGKAVSILMAKHKGDVAAVASQIGKSEQWVRQHGAIHDNLSKKWRTRVLEDEDYDYLTTSHLGLIARFPQHIQERDIIKAMQYHGRFTVRELEKHLSEFFRMLKKAPFDTGECVNCANRSSSQPTLWAEKTEDVSGAKDRCLDATCWRSKEIAEGKRKFAELKKKHPGLVCVADEHPEDITKKTYGRILRGWDYTTAKEGSKGAVPALVVNGKGMGKIIFVKPTQQQGQSQTPEKPKTLKQLRAELDMQRWRKVFGEFYDRLAGMELKTDHGDPLYAVAAIVASSGCSVDGGDDYLELLANYDKGKTDKARKQLAEKLWKAIRDNLRYAIDTTGDEDSVELNQAIGTIFGFNLQEEYKKVCGMAEFKEPAEWANLSADGTPKTDKVKGKKQKSKDVKKCYVCGCTEDNPCETPTGPCHWAGAVKGKGDLCSACVGKKPKAKKSKKAAKSKKAKS